jgi:hypothetical protein
MQRVTKKLHDLFASRGFAIGLLIFFVFEALWIVFSGIYPLAFDEEFHFGIIQFYSHHWLPFVSSQPSGSGQYGPIIADPSYLFHYLMSFPYRLLHVFTHNDTAVIIMLRLMNVAMFSAGLVLFYKLLRRVGSSRLLANASLAMFVLIPIAPLLAAHINYDNLMMLLVAASCWLVLDIRDDLQTRTINLKRYAALIFVVILSSLVKYAFLPIALAIALYVGYQLWRTFRRHGAQFKKSLAKAHNALSNRAKVGLVVLLVMSAGLFAQRYVTNTIRYHTPLPDCGAVIGTQECLAYGPWARDYNFAKDKGQFDHSPLKFTRTWFGGMHRRLFFMITGKTRGYMNYPPMPVMAKGSIILAIAGIAALLFYWRRVFAGHSELYFLLLVTLTYCAVLWLYNYRDYLGTGRPVAINGRYLLMILFPFMAITGRALAIALRRFEAARMWLVAAAIIVMLQGGGLISFILRSNESWYWPNNTITHTNNGVRHMLKPLIIEGQNSPDN